MSKVRYYTNLFFIYSFIGYVLETIIKTFFYKNMNNGIMYGPWIPVYGFGAILVIFIMRLVFNRLKVSRFIKIIITLFISMVLITGIEYLGGILIEKMFKKVFWDYSKFKYNFGHYISLEMTVLWGVLTLIIIYVINPLLNSVIKKIPKFITVLVSLLFIVDLIFTILLKLHIFHR